MGPPTHGMPCKKSRPNLSPGNNDAIADPAPSLNRLIEVSSQLRTPTALEAL
jgi:hypothetical protein